MLQTLVAHGVVTLGPCYKIQQTRLETVTANSKFNFIVSTKHKITYINTYRYINTCARNDRRCTLRKWTISRR